VQLVGSGLSDDSGGAVVLPLAHRASLSPEWGGDSAVAVRARCEKEGSAIRVELVERGGDVYVSDLPLTPVWHDWRLPLRGFLPSKGSQMKRQVDLARLESVRVALRQMSPTDDGAALDNCDVRVESVTLQPVTSLWRTTSVAATEPIVIFDPECDRGNLERRAAWAYQERLVPGRTQERLALRIGMERFDRWVWEVSCRHWFGDRVRRRGGTSSLFDTLRLVVRASAEGTDKVQIALIDEHGSAHGAVISLTRDWREVRLPLAALSPVAAPEVPHSWSLPIAAREKDDACQGLVVRELAALQISFGPGLFPDEADKASAIELGEVALEVSQHSHSAGGGEGGR